MNNLSYSLSDFFKDSKNRFKKDSKYRMRNENALARDNVRTTRYILKRTKNLELSSRCIKKVTLYWHFVGSHEF